MNSNFEGGEIVRLIGSSEYGDLPIGTYGVLWGIYVDGPSLYEATFVLPNGELADCMFESGDVELVADPKEASCVDKLLEIRAILERSSANQNDDPPGSV